MAVQGFIGFESRDLTLDDASGLTGTATISTTQARTGTASFRCNPASGAAGYANFLDALWNAYVHFGLYIATLPTVTRVIYGNPSGTANLRLNADGTIALYSSSVLVTTSTIGLSTNQWYWIGVKIDAASAQQLIQVDGVPTGASITNAGYSSSARLGCSGTEASAIDVYFDDVISDSAGFLAPSKVIDLLPTADSAIGTGWTLGSGGTTGLWDAVNNQPPTAVADAGTTAQIRNAASAANSNYDATLQTYTVGGVASGSTVLAVQNIIATGAPVVTSAKLGTVGNVSNPAITNVNLASGGTAAAFWSGVAAGAFPTGWKPSLGTLTTSPSVALGTAPVMRVQQVTASTRIAMVAYMALRVAWTPAAVAAGNPPYVNPYVQVLPQ